MLNLLDEIEKSQYLFPSTIKEIDEMNGEEFEDFLFWYFKKNNYDVSITSKTNDFGIDLIVSFNNPKTNKKENIGIQAKRWSTPIPKSELTKMLKAKDYYKLDHQFLITTSRPTSEANHFAKNHEILIKGREFIYQMLDELKKMNNIKFRKLNQKFKTYDPDINILEKLIFFRKQKSKEEKIPTYMIFSNDTAKEIATIKPKNINDLKAISGIGEKKIEKYGEEILKLINE